MPGIQPHVLRVRRDRRQDIAVLQRRYVREAQGERSLETEDVPESQLLGLGRLARGGAGGDAVVAQRLGHLGGGGGEEAAEVRLYQFGGVKGLGRGVSIKKNP